MKIKDVVARAIAILESGEPGVDGASCIAVGRAWHEMACPPSGTSTYRAWFVWERAAVHINGGEAPEWWDYYSTREDSIAIRVAHLQKWAELEGEKEFIV